MAIENHLCSWGIFPSLPPVMTARKDGPKNVKGDIQRAVSYRFLAPECGGPVICGTSKLKNFVSRHPKVQTEPRNLNPFQTCHCSLKPLKPRLLWSSHADETCATGARGRAFLNTLCTDLIDDRLSELQFFFAYNACWLMVAEMGPRYKVNSNYIL